MAEPLKDMFGPARYRAIAEGLKAQHPAFDADRFVALAEDGLDDLSLTQRLTRACKASRACLPGDFRDAVAVLRAAAPDIGGGFAGVFLSEFVSLYVLDDPDFSLDALKYFTRFGSAEFAVRFFLRRDFEATLAVMRSWAEDDNEHVRRLSSEGLRPRLPWGFQLKNLIADPSPAFPILNRLNADAADYVRKSVGNHLNDIGKDHPEAMLDLVGGWDRSHPHTAWIVRRGLRSLVKAGDARALELLGFVSDVAVEVAGPDLSTTSLTLGDVLRFAVEFRSTADKAQMLAVDYIVHYVRKNGSSAKVFKWREPELAAGETVRLEKKQRFVDFSTRKHHAGRHRLEVQVNGAVRAVAEFDLVT